MARGRRQTKRADGGAKAAGTSSVGGDVVVVPAAAVAAAETAMEEGTAKEATAALVEPSSTADPNVPIETKNLDGGHGHGHGGGGSEQQQGSPFWLVTCFCMLMGSGVLFGMMLEWATSGGRSLHETSYIFVTSAIYSATARVCRDVSGETPTTISPSALLAVATLSMGSSFTSVRALRYVIFPVQVLAKSCKPVPVMVIGAFRGKSYPWSKYVNVAVVVTGVCLFMGGGDPSSASAADLDKTGPMMWFGVGLLLLSLVFDGVTGVYEDELMSQGHLGPFELMYNIQFGKMIIAFSALLFNNEISFFFGLVQEQGVTLLLLGLAGAMLQISIFMTISKCGALTCALFGVARKITTLVVSILFFGHRLNMVQTLGLLISIGSMIRNFISRSQGAGSKKQGGTGKASMLQGVAGEGGGGVGGEVELGGVNDGPKASLHFKDQARAKGEEKKPLLLDSPESGGVGVGGGGAEDEDEDEDDAFPTQVPNAKGHC